MHCSNSDLYLRLVRRNCHAFCQVLNLDIGPTIFFSHFLWINRLIKDNATHLNAIQVSIHFYLHSAVNQIFVELIINAYITIREIIDAISQFSVLHFCLICVLVTRNNMWLDAFTSNSLLVTKTNIPFPLWWVLHKFLKMTKTLTKASRFQMSCDDANLHVWLNRILEGLTQANE